MAKLRGVSPRHGNQSKTERLTSSRILVCYNTVVLTVGSIQKPPVRVVVQVRGGAGPGKISRQRGKFLHQCEPLACDAIAAYRGGKFVRYIQHTVPAPLGMARPVSRRQKAVVRFTAAHPGRAHAGLLSSCPAGWGQHPIQSSCGCSIYKTSRNFSLLPV